MHPFSQSAAEYKQKVVSTHQDTGLSPSWSIRSPVSVFRCVGASTSPLSACIYRACHRPDPHPSSSWETLLEFPEPEIQTRASHDDVWTGCRVWSVVVCGEVVNGGHKAVITQKRIEYSYLNYLQNFYVWTWFSETKRGSDPGSKRGENQSFWHGLEPKNGLGKAHACQVYFILFWYLSALPDPFLDRFVCCTKYKKFGYGAPLTGWKKRWCFLYKSFVELQNEVGSVVLK